MLGTLKSPVSDNKYGNSCLISSISNFLCSEINSKTFVGNEIVLDLTTGLISLSGFKSSFSWVLMISEDSAWEISEDNFPFECEDWLGITLGFLSIFSGSGTTATGSGSVFFLVTSLLFYGGGFFGILGPFSSFLGAKITIEESPGE